MTREEAILLFEISAPEECSECYKAHDFTCSGADARRCEAYRRAIAALREQEERSKGCEHCLSKINKDMMMAHGFAHCADCGRRLEEV